MENKTASALENKRVFVMKGTVIGLIAGLLAGGVMVLFLKSWSGVVVSVVIGGILGVPVGAFVGRIGRSAGGVSTGAYVGMTVGAVAGIIGGGIFWLFAANFAEVVNSVFLADFQAGLFQAAGLGMFLGGVHGMMVGAVVGGVLEKPAGDFQEYT